MDKNNDDSTKKVLQGILANLYKEQSHSNPNLNGSYIIGGDNQFLGYVNNNKYDSNSLLNKYGPYGSKYSPTSIFNIYSQYGSKYGILSLSNLYSSTPPKLFINNKFFCHITDNQYIKPRIASEVFFYNLNNNLDGLIRGEFIKNESELRQRNGSSYIEGADGFYLGSLDLNQFDAESIFNQFSNYGSQFSLTSIFNQFGNYGGSFSQLSPYNQFSNTPPKIFIKGKFIAYLTKNKFLNPAIDPDNLKDWLIKNNL